MLIVLVGAVAISAFVQGFLVLGFVRKLWGWQRELLEDRDCPPATVILCLRGGDPFLERCIEGIKNLEYPDYDVLFVVDHENDPSISVLDPYIKNGWENARVLYLKDRIPTCSLKCSSLLTAIKCLRSETQFIALIDADTVPHKSWLRELATGLQSPSVGAATGNRWYMPEKESDGAWIRYVWNAAAVVQMAWYRIAWGGTLAIKTEAIERADLLEKWSRSLCEDTMLKRQLGKVGLRVNFVPGLMMINRENCSVSSFYSWVKRQLLTARLYHPMWWAVVGHGASSVALLIVCWGYVAWSAWAGEWRDSILLAATLFLFHLYLCALIPWMERPVSAMARARGEPHRWAGQGNVLRLCSAVWQTQWVYSLALLQCLLMRKVEWRGIEYDIHGPFDIKQQSYLPYESSQPVSSPGNSL